MGRPGVGCVLHDRREGCGQARVMKGRAGARWVWEEMERERTKARLLQRLAAEQDLQIKCAKGFMKAAEK